MDTTTPQVAPGPGADGTDGRQPVPVNVYETTEALVVVAAVPAVMAEDVVVEATDAELHIRADVRTAARKDYLVHEWEYGGYDRTVALPEGFDGPVSASLGNGQLAVRVERDGIRSGSSVTVHPHSPAHEDTD